MRRNKINHGAGEIGFYKNAKIIAGENLFLAIQRFKNELKEGDSFWLHTKNGVVLGYDCATDLPDFMKFTVYRKYPHCVELHHTAHTWKWDYTHKYTPDYAKLYFQVYPCGVDQQDCSQ